MKQFEATRRTMQNSGIINANPAAIFPQLCPTREYDWIETWDCDLVYSDSGYAEMNCIFTTSFDNHKQTWSVSRYSPENTLIEFTVFIDDFAIMHYQVAVMGIEKEKSEITWTRTFTGLNNKGNLFVKSIEEDDFQARMNKLNQELDYFLVHGEMLKEK